MMTVPKSEMFRNFAIFNKAFMFLIKKELWKKGFEHLFLISSSFHFFNKTNLEQYHIKNAFKNYFVISML